jgi:hypothetical protein
MVSRQIYEAVLARMDVAQLRLRKESFPEPDLALETHQGSYPTTDLGDLAALRAAIYSTYGHEVPHTDVQRTLLASQSEAGQLQFTRLGVLARDTSTGRVVGIVETIWNAASPALIRDWYEAVAAQRRGRRLGAALTAALLIEVIARLPLAKVVRIGMHEGAHSLHARTEEIGFRFCHREIRWAIWSQAVSEYLESRD